MSDFDPTLNAWLPVPTHCDALAVPYWLAQSEQTTVGFSPDPQLKPLINASDHLLPMLQQDPARDLITGQLRSGSYSYDLNLELAGTAITMSVDSLAQDRQDVSLTIDRTTVDLLIRPRRIFLRSDGERWIVLNQDRLLTRTFSEALGSLIRSLSVPQMLRRLSRVATMEQCNQSTDSRPQRADVRVGDWSALIPRSKSNR